MDETLYNFLKFINEKVYAIDEDTKAAIKRYEAINKQNDDNKHKLVLGGHIPSTIEFDNQGYEVYYYLHSNPGQVVGTGFRCSRCGRLFNTKEIIEACDDPYTVRHLKCNTDKYPIVAHALIRINKTISYTSAWYRNHRGMEFLAYIHDDGVAEPDSMVPILEAYFFKSNLKYGIYKGDYKVLKYDSISDSKKNVLIKQDDDMKMFTSTKDVIKIRGGVK